MIYGIVGNENDAWDLAQEAFLKAWRSIHQFEGRSSFYTWLGTPDEEPILKHRPGDTASPVGSVRLRNCHQDASHQKDAIESLLWRRCKCQRWGQSLCERIEILECRGLTQSGSNPSKLTLRESLSSSATSSPPIFVGVMLIAVAVVAIEPFDPIDLARKIFHRYHWYCWRPVVWISFVESPCTWRPHNIPPRIWTRPN
jgi:hypothetical protein